MNIDKLQPMIAVGQKALSLDDFSTILRRQASFTLDGPALGEKTLKRTPLSIGAKEQKAPTILS